MATSNFMAVFNKLEKFDGKDDLATWLQKFERYCAIAQKNDDAKGQIIMLCLTGQALAVVEQLEHEREGHQTFTQVRARLETVFDTVSSRERRMSEFENRTQRLDESEDEFMLSLVQLYKSANPRTQNEELQKSVNSLI